MPFDLKDAMAKWEALELSEKGVPSQPFIDAAAAITNIFDELKGMGMVRCCRLHCGVRAPLAISSATHAVLPLRSSLTSVGTLPRSRSASPTAARRSRR